MTRSRENRPAKDWPIGSTVEYLDAWGHNPVTGKVVKHYPIETNLLVEDTHGVIHFGQTWRIATEPPSQKLTQLFDDLLGDLLGDTGGSNFEDLLG